MNRDRFATSALRRFSQRLVRRGSLFLSLLVVIWFSAVLAGLVILWRYEATPGPSGTPTPQWPADSAIELHPTLPTLVMFAHPRCPCTRASIEELAKFMADHAGQVDARVYFYLPAGSDPEWSRQNLYNAAKAIPGVTVALDQDNVEAERFGAKTSGHVLLFDPAGNLQFSGGMTAARGHVGDNAGSAALQSLIEDREPALHDTMVFGCPLATPQPVQ